MIKAIFFDFDDTLGNRKKAAYAMYKDILSDLVKLNFDEYEFEAVLQDMIIWDQFGNTDKNYVKEKVMKKYGVKIPIDDFNEFWESNFWKYTILEDDALYVLSELKKTYKIGIITNGPSDGQTKKIETVGLLPYLDCLVVSGTYGINKPDSLLFMEAFKMVNVKPEEAVYVGDTFSNDIFGARRVGCLPVWITNSKAVYCDKEILKIDQLSELIELLKEINK
ncbi:HAD family hydrolase [Anaerorhabdus sp.]|uniref:HAD family hydrolase n=1 Tax=Anaerorhabdus sp. TaxID=1872524 RepID=UPI002FCCA182